MRSVMQKVRSQCHRECQCHEDAMAAFFDGGVVLSLCSLFEPASSSSAFRFVPAILVGDPGGDLDDLGLKSSSEAGTRGGVRILSGVRDLLRLPEISVRSREASVDFDDIASAWQVAWYI